MLAALYDDFLRPALRIQFRVAAKAYRIIEDNELPILVPYGAAGRDLRNRLLSGHDWDYRTLRAAQRHLVTIPRRQLALLESGAAVMQHESGLYLLCNDSAYLLEKGLSLAATGMSPALLIQ